MGSPRRQFVVKKYSYLPETMAEASSCHMNGVFKSDGCGHGCETGSLPLLVHTIKSVTSPFILFQLSHHSSRIFLMTEGFITPSNSQFVLKDGIYIQHQRLFLILASTQKLLHRFTVAAGAPPKKKSHKFRQHCSLLFISQIKPSIYSATSYFPFLSSHFPLCP